MKLTFQIAPGCSLESDLQTPSDMKKVFAAIANAQEIFTVKNCGNCKSPNVRLCYRTPKGYQYYSVKCHDCWHELKISEQKPENGGRLYANKAWEPPFKDDDPSQPRGRQEPEYHYEPAPPAQPSNPQPVAAPAGAGGVDSSIPW